MLLSKSHILDELFTFPALPHVVVVPEHSGLNVKRVGLIPTIQPTVWGKGA